MKKMVLVAAAALIDKTGKILLAQRPEGKSMAGLWEFPGGKVDLGESPETALIRELEEELAIITYESCLAPFAFASHQYENFQLLMPLYICRKWDGMIDPQEGQQVKWVKVKDLRKYEMPPADLPLISMLEDFLQ